MSQIEQKAEKNERVTIKITSTELDLIDAFIDRVKDTYNRRINISSVLKLSLQMTKGIIPPEKILEDLQNSDRRRKRI